MDSKWWFTNRLEDLKKVVVDKYYDEMIEDSRARKVDLEAMEALILKQQIEFPKILEELKANNRKVKHWAWYVWPTSQPGRNEPVPRTWVAPYLIHVLLEHTNLMLWTTILEKINGLIDVSGWGVIPMIDYGRIGYFIGEFYTQDEFLRGLYPEFYAQIVNLKINYGELLEGEDRWKVPDETIKFLNQKFPPEDHLTLIDKLKSPRGIILDRFTATNTNSDFSYGYGRYTIYVDIDGDDISIIAVTRGPFNDRIGLPEMADDMKERMVNDINRRLKKGNMSIMKKKVLRNLRNEIRKTIVSEKIE